TSDIVKFDLSPPLLHDAAEAHDVDALLAWFNGFDGPIEYEVRDLAVTASADVAFCRSLNRLNAAPRGIRGFPFNLCFRAPLGLRKVGGRWLIDHEHNSTPFYMDEQMKAAVDLEP